MGSLVKCSIIIYDDFGNVLLAERGKKNERTWGLFGKDIKGKETDEKCISKAIDKDLKCTIFDLKSSISNTLSKITNSRTRSILISVIDSEANFISYSSIII